MFKKEIRIALTLALATCLYTLPARAALMNFTGTFAVQIENAILSTAFSGTADVNTSTGAFTFVDASDAQIASWAELTAHPLFDLVAIGLTFQPGGAAFDANGGMNGGFGGAGPVAVQLVGATANGMNRFVVNEGGTLGVPWTQGGKMAASYYMSEGTVVNTQAAFVGSKWTTGTFGFAVNGRDYAIQGADARTENQGGLLTLVTPIFLGSSLEDGGLGAMGILLLDFDGGLSMPSASFSAVPEPGTALLLGAGVLGLTVAGRRKRSN